MFNELSPDPVVGDVAVVVVVVAGLLMVIAHL